MQPDIGLSFILVKIYLQKNVNKMGNDLYWLTIFFEIIFIDEWLDSQLQNIMFILLIDYFHSLEEITKDDMMIYYLLLVFVFFRSVVNLLVNESNT